MPWSGEEDRLGPEAESALGLRLEGERAYQLIRLLGEGGMGRVFLAERADGEFRQQVAIKLLAWFLGGDQGAARRFRVERQILARLSHPNIARLLDGGTTAQGQSYLVMEYVEGAPIDAYADRQKLDVEQRVRLFLKVCEAVRVAHQNLVVHRDLKPGNILVTPEGEPKLLDFGIAKLLAPEPGGEKVDTVHGEMLLTPRYASPEQVRAEAITTTSDVYSLGVILFELLTGRSPYKTESLGLLRLPVAVCNEIPEPPSTVALARRRELGRDLDAIVLKALRKEPGERYASVEALAEDLRAWLDGRPVLARPATRAYQLGKFLERHRWMVVAGLLVAALLVGWTLTLRHQLARTESERHQAERARELLVEVFGGSDLATNRSRELSARQVLDRAAARVRSRSDDPPELRASLFASLGRVYLSLGLVEQAEPMLQEALAHGMSGAPPAERARASTALARLRYQQGRTAESVELLRATLDREASALDAATRGALWSLLGRALVERGFFDEGEAALRQGLALGREHARSSVGPPRPELVECLINLAMTLGSRYAVVKRQEATELLIEAIAAARRIPAEHGDPMLLESALENLAWLHLDAGDWRSAEPLVAEAEKIARAVLGEDHPSLLDLRNYRALLQFRQGDFAGAERTFCAVLAAHPEQSGFPAFERLRGNYGAMIMLQGRFAEGEALLETALAAHRRTGTVGWADVYVDLWILAMSAYERGDLAAARSLASQAEQELSRLPPEMPYVSFAYTYGGAARSWLEGPAAGEAHLRRAVDLQRAALPPGHPDRVVPLAELAAALLRQGRQDEAATLAAEAAGVALSLPANHWDRAWGYAVDAAVRLHQGDPAARAKLEAQLPRLLARHGPDHPRVAWLRQLLAGKIEQAAE